MRQEAPEGQGEISLILRHGAEQVLDQCDLRLTALREA